MLSAPLWDPVQCQFVGIMTVTDFIDILRLYKSSGKDVAALASRSIAEILEEAAEETKSSSNPFRLRPFIGGDASCSLKQACHLLHLNNLDFLWNSRAFHDQISI